MCSKGGFKRILSEPSLKLLKNNFLRERIDRKMEGIDKCIQTAFEEQDWSNVIRLIEERHNVSRLKRQRDIFKSFQKNNLEERKEISNLLWLTVNPSPESTFTEFKKIVEKCFLKKWIKSYMYVYEQRGMTEEEVGKGFHMHAIIRKPEDKSRAHCIRELSSSYKKVCDVSNYHLFNTKWIDKEECQRKIEYITGDKVSTETNNKSLKQEMDVLFRQNRGLQKFYSLGNIGDATEDHEETK